MIDDLSFQILFALIDVVHCLRKPPPPSSHIIIIEIKPTVPSNNKKLQHYINFSAIQPHFQCKVFVVVVVVYRGGK